MSGGAEEERQAHVFPCLDSIPERRRHELASLPIPDELLAEILLRLPTPADLVRASAAYVSFRRVAADRSFLRRFRKLHVPPLLGVLDGRKVFYPAITAHPSASVASAVDLAADFFFSFLPAPAMFWVTRDVRDGRVLLDRIPQHRMENRFHAIFREVVACDPLHRRYLLLPPIPAALVEDTILTSNQLHVETFLVPPSCAVEAATEDETSFRVISMAQCKTRLVTFVFSSNTGQWQAVPSHDLSAGLPPLIVMGLSNSRHYVYDCFYWMTADREENKLLVLDIKTMKFSIAEPPPAVNIYNYAMVEAGEGRPGMFVLSFNGTNLSYFIRQNDGGSSSEWHKVKTIALASRTFLTCHTEKYLLLFQRHSSLPEVGCFSLDIETFQHQKLCSLGSKVYKMHAYSNFPPSLLSLPTISSGVEKGPEKEMLEEGCAASSSTESPQPSE